MKSPGRPERRLTFANVVKSLPFLFHSDQLSVTTDAMSL